MLHPGDAAPDFVLKDADDNDLRLSTLSGRPIILYFYPKDDTPGCTIEAKRIRDAYQQMAEYGAAVVGISMDSPESHGRFRDKHDLPFHLVSDPEGRVHDLYEAWRTSLLGRKSLAVRRCTFLIDEDGIIRKTYKHVNPLRHARQLVSDLERLAAQKSWGKFPGSEKEAQKGFRQLLKR